MPLALTDTHCHLTYPGLVERLPDVVADAGALGVRRMVTIGTSPADAADARSVAEQYPGVWFTAGLHPLHVADDPVLARDVLYSQLRQLLAHPRCVAIGETGLDRHHPQPPIALQRPAFEWQLELAHETSKPVVIHSRKAIDETLEMLRASGLPGERFVFHCFTGLPEEVERIVSFGAYVGFTGVVTYPKAPEVAASFDRVPTDRVLVETDAPYLAPEPHRRVRTNEPKYVRTVAEFLAHRRGMGLDVFAAETEANASRFYRLP